MQPERLAFIFARRAQVGQPAAGQQAAAKSAQPAGSLRIKIHGMRPARRRNPGQRQPFVGSRADIHAAVEQYAEGQPRAGADIRHAQAAFDSIRPFAQPDAGNLGQVADIVQ